LSVHFYPDKILLVDRDGKLSDIMGYLVK